MEAAPNFTKITPVKAYQSIVEQIEGAMISGELTPGSHLPGERELMLSFGVSRATIREALRVLETKGLIRSRPGTPLGPEVLTVSPGMMHETVHRYIQFGYVTPSEVVEFRIMLESTASRLAARHRTDVHLVAMREALEAMRNSAHSGSEQDRFGIADVAFHSAIWAASGNRLIKVCGLAVRDYVISMINDYLEQRDDIEARMGLSVEHDTTILNAIEKGDGEGAGMLTRQYLYEYYGQYLNEHDGGSSAGVQ